MLGASLSFAHDMRFQLVSVGDRKVCKDQCLQIIAADGDIVRSTPDEFVEFVKGQFGNKRIRTVIMFNSPGGEVYPSLRLGLILRKVKFATLSGRVVGDAAQNGGGIAPGFCLSACVYTFMGGTERTYVPGSVFGIHRPYTIRAGEEPKRTGFNELDAIAKGDDQHVLGQYSKIMGVSPNLTVQALRTPSSTMHYLTPAEIAAWKLAKKQM